jgi:hypothetical protein
VFIMSFRLWPIPKLSVKTFRKGNYISAMREVIDKARKVKKDNKSCNEKLDILHFILLQ